MEKFWKKVNRGSEDSCWEWQGAIDSLGYGMTFRNGKNIRAHRLAFLLANEYLPDSGVIRHLCGNRRCTNPNHLAHGTKKDNAADAIRHGSFKNISRFRKKAQEHHNAVLTNAQVMQMREMRKCGMSGAAIARHFSINYRTTMAAISGQNYRSVA